MRDWAKLLASAKERGITTTALAHEIGVNTGQVSDAARRKGVLLKGGRGHQGPKRFKSTDWASELAIAKATHEGINAFCARLGCSTEWAKRKAGLFGHVWPSRRNNAKEKTRRRWALRFAGSPPNLTINEFCAMWRVSADGQTLKAWAHEFGYTFASSNSAAFSRTRGGRPTKHRAFPPYPTDATCRRT